MFPKYIQSLSLSLSIYIYIYTQNNRRWLAGRPGPGQAQQPATADFFVSISCIFFCIFCMYMKYHEMAMLWHSSIVVAYPTYSYLGVTFLSCPHWRPESGGINMWVRTSLGHIPVRKLTSNCCLVLVHPWLLTRKTLKEIESLESEFLSSERNIPNLYNNVSN